MSTDTEKKSGAPVDDYVVRSTTSDSDGNVGELHSIQHTTTKRGLKSRHAQMIAIGGTIGTGLFVGTGAALARAGPGFLFLAYTTISLFVYGVVTLTTEMSTFLPVEGVSMAFYASRYVSKSLGFALGWLYWYSFAIIVPYEVTAAGIVIDFWPNDVNVAVWISIMTVLIVGLNFSPVKMYGETEFWFASIKVLTLIGLLFLSFILFWGGGPDTGRLGFHYWKHGLATKEYLVTGDAGRWWSFVWVLCYSVFAFAFAPELLVITAGEMQSPRANLPKAAKRYFYRLLIFYVGGTLCLGVICDSRSTALTGGGVGAGSSPWAIAIKEAGIAGLDSVINAVIVTSAWSSGNSYLYMSSRMLFSLACAGNAPKVFTRCTKSGVPYVAVFTSSLFCALAYLNVGTDSGVVFDWFINLTNTAGMISWVCCGIIYLRFRKAVAVQGVSVPYRSRTQPYMAYAVIVMFTFICLFNGFSVFFPGQWDMSTFLTSYVGIPIFFAIYFGHRIYTYKTEPWMFKPQDVDLKTNLDEVEALAELDAVADEQAKVGKKKAWWHFIKRIWE